MQISEIRNESLEEDGPGNSGLLGRGISKNQFSDSGFHFNSWGDSLHFSDNFPSFKRDQENDVKRFSGSQVKAVGLNMPCSSTCLSFHTSMLIFFSLPTTLVKKKKVSESYSWFIPEHNMLCSSCR